MPSWKKILQSGSAFSVLNITASNISLGHTSHALLYNTESGHITYHNHGNTIPPVVSVMSGTFRYYTFTGNNPFPISIPSVIIELRSQTGAVISSTVTNIINLPYEFSFTNISFGNYFIRPRTGTIPPQTLGSYTWPNSAVDATDLTAMQLLANAGNPIEIGIGNRAADVNGDDFVDASDIGDVSNKLFNLSYPLLKGDWVFQLTGSGVPPETYWYSGDTTFGLPYTASQQNITDIEIRVRAVGDVNGNGWVSGL